ncbi:hypothetical protein ACFQV4_14905 [Streptomyces thermocarboxydus]
MHALVDAFRKHVDDQPRAHAAQVKELYDDRTGVSYLLPPQGNLGRFYQALMERLAESHQLGPNGDEAALMHKLVDAELRRGAFAIGRHHPDAAVAEVKAAFKHRVQRLFSERPDGRQSRALLPRMSTLLAAEAGDAEAAQQVSARALEQFRYKLVPAAYRVHPEGNGRLKVLITYPGSRRTAVDTYLEKHLRLPQDSQRTIEFRAVDTDSISVVLFRSEMSLTEVPEARKVLRQWAKAQESRRDEDVLRWRQRLGYRDDWLASTPDDRAHILNRLLCALWNGQIDYQGDPASPQRLRIRLHDDPSEDALGIQLALTDHQDGISSWAGLLRAYERWVLLAEENIVQSYCKVVMNTLPRGLGTSGSEPSELYLQLVHEVAPRQLRLLDERERRYGARVADWTRRLREFWAETLPDALGLPFPEGENPAHPTLRDLEEWVRENRSGGAYAGPPEEDAWTTGRIPGGSQAGAWDRSSQQRPAELPQRFEPADGGRQAGPYGGAPHDGAPRRDDGWDVPSHGRPGVDGPAGGVPSARPGPAPAGEVPAARTGGDADPRWPSPARHDERTRHWPDTPPRLPGPRRTVHVRRVVRLPGPGAGGTARRPPRYAPRRPDGPRRDRRPPGRRSTRPSRAAPNPTPAGRAQVRPRRGASRTRTETPTGPTRRSRPAATPARAGREARDRRGEPGRRPRLPGRTGRARGRLRAAPPDGRTAAGRRAGPHRRPAVPGGGRPGRADGARRGVRTGRGRADAGRGASALPGDRRPGAATPREPVPGHAVPARFVPGPAVPGHAARGCPRTGGRTPAAAGVRAPVVPHGVLWAPTRGRGTTRAPATPARRRRRRWPR